MASSQSQPAGGGNPNFQRFVAEVAGDPEKGGNNPHKTEFHPVGGWQNPFFLLE
jgi:hypothetical protein